MRIIQLKDETLKGVVGGSAAVSFGYATDGALDHVFVVLTKDNGGAINVLVDRDIGIGTSTVTIPGTGI